MTRDTPANFKRPARISHTAEVVQGKQSVRSILKQLPAHYIETIRSNPNISACCKEIDNLEFHTEKTDPSLEHPNKGIFTCKSCGKKHIRMAQGGGRFGA